MMAITMEPLFGSTAPERSIRSENSFWILFMREESIWDGPNDDHEDFCCILTLQHE